MAAPTSPKKHRAPPDFEGPITDRHTTDCLFLLLKFLSWVAMTVIFIVSSGTSNFWTVVKPVDYLGNVCGVSVGFESLPSLRYIDISGNGVCSTACYSGAAVPLQPAQWTTSSVTCRYSVTPNNVVAQVASSQCLPNYASVSVLGYCIPTSFSTLTTQFDTASGTTIELSSTFDSGLSNAERFASDIYQSAPVLFGCGLGVSFVLGFVMLLFLRIPGLASLITWVSLFTVPLLLGALGYFCWSVYVDYNNSDNVVNEEWQTTAFYVSAIVLWVVAGLMVLFAIAVRKRVNLAVKCTKATARAVGAIPIMVFYPILQLLGFMLYFVPWVVYLFTIVGMGELRNDGVAIIAGQTISYSYYHYTDMAKYSFWFLLFELYWTAQFIISLGSITLSLGFAKWYFTIDKNSVSSGSFLQSNYVCIRYHAGTAAFGSLIVAIVQIIRTVFAYINARIEAMERADPTSIMPYRAVSRALRGCLCCCLWCLENVIKFVNKNAYVQTAIFGTSFCTSAKHAFELIARNVLRILAMTFVSSLTFALTKIWVIFGTTTVTFYTLQYYYETTLYSIYGICVLAGLLAWFVADMFTDVMEVGVTTILQCYLADEEILGGIGEYCPSELKNFFDGIHQESKEMRMRGSGTDDGIDDEVEVEIEVQETKRGGKVVTH